VAQGAVDVRELLAAPHLVAYWHETDVPLRRYTAVLEEKRK